MSIDGDYLLRNWKRRKTWTRAERIGVGREMKRASFWLQLVGLCALVSVWISVVVSSQIARPISQVAAAASDESFLAAEQRLDSASQLSHWLQSQTEPSVYRCARHCSCSMVQMPDWTGADVDNPKQVRQMVNLSQVKCESSQFSDILTIDRRTQIIHISLPLSSHQQATTTTKASESQPASSQTSSKAPKKNQLSLMSKLFNLSSSSAYNADNKANQITPMTTTTASNTAANQFRMPRLMQFGLLREIVIINLRIEVCDSEVFKRGQRLMRLKWNGNSLKQVSRNCFKHLDKLIHLNLDHNQLEELESALFSYLVALRHLSLAHNQLTDLAAHQFANLSQLISLNLVGNSFKSINLNLLEPMQNSLQLLALADNQIRSLVLNQSASQTNATSSGNQFQQQQQLISGVIFRNLIKLNVDHNQFERIKLLQLHRFFNVKFLSVRGNNIATIRDKAFNGLKLVELNLAQNKLQSISRCAFCNSTIKRLNLAENNISTATPAPVGPTLTAAAAHPLVAVDPLAGTRPINDLAVPHQAAPPLVLSSPASSASMLVLGQSIFGPLFNHLEYLDLSHNLHLAGQLELLLEPLLELQYLNLAAIGLDRSLPTPSLFKNLRRLAYLNLSNNHLDQLVTETIEPLKELQVLDLSRNDLSELEESFLVTLDELPMMKLVDFGSNPWYCSQCKITSLYEWISRSSIYNATCLVGQQQTRTMAAQLDADKPTSSMGSSKNELDADEDDHDDDEDTIEPSLGFIYKQQARSSSGPSTRTRANTYNELNANDQLEATIDFELILDLFQDEPSSFADQTSGAVVQPTSVRSSSSSSSGDNVPNYQFDDSISLQHEFQARKRQLSRRLLSSLASPDDDNSIARTIESVHAISEAALNAADPLEGDPGGEVSPFERVLKRFFPRRDFCLKCEFPSELRSFYLHELIPTDFRYCAGSAPRTGASEPKVGLTLAIVIISVLLVVIIVVIVMYRKKSNTYYLGDDLLESGEPNGHSGAQLAGGRKNQPVLSVSSDMEHQYGDATDYSSPPMSQTYSNEESSFSGSNSQEVEEEEEDDDDDDEEEDEDEEVDYEDEEEEEDEEDENEEELDGEARDDEDAHRRDGGGGAGGGSHGSGHGRHEHAHFQDIDHESHESRKSEHKQPAPSSAGPRSQNSLDNVSSLPPSSSSKQEDHQVRMQISKEVSQPAPGREMRTSGETNPNEPAESSSLSSQQPKQQQQQQAEQADLMSQQQLRSMKRRAVTRRGKSQLAPTGAKSEKSPGPNRVGSLSSKRDQASASRQSSHFDRDDSTPIFITRLETSSKIPNDEPATSHQLNRAPAASSTTPASLSAGDLLSGSPLSLACTTAGGAAIAGTAVPATSSSHRSGEGRRPNLVDNQSEKLSRQRLAATKASSASVSSGSHEASSARLVQRSHQQRSAEMASSNKAASSMSAPKNEQHQPTGLGASSTSDILGHEDGRRKLDNEAKLRSTASATVINVGRNIAQQLNANGDQQQEGHSLARHNERRQHRQSSEHSTAGSVSFAIPQAASPQRPSLNVVRQQQRQQQPPARQLMRSAQTIAYASDENSSKRDVSIIQLVAAPTAKRLEHAGGQQGNGLALSGSALEPLQNGAVPMRAERQPTDDDSGRSGRESAARQPTGGGGRQKLASGSSRGRPLMKQQPREHNSPPLSLTRPRQTSAESSRPPDQLHGRQPAESFSSMELDEVEAQLLDELPSDLDESNPDLLTGSDTTTTTSNGVLNSNSNNTSSNNNNNNSNDKRRRAQNSIARYQTQSGPALDFDEEEDEREAGAAAEGSGDESIEQLRGLGLMRMSHSTHSALTRAGSGDFE